MDDEKWGLVLGGGGAKGAYQIGVWKALQELNFPKFSGISGASVGALNAALWCIGDYQNAENIWSNIRWSDFVTLSNDGKRIAEREGLRKILREKTSLQAIRESKIPVYASILSARNLRVEYRKLNGGSDDYLESVLLASSSIPCFYGKTDVDGAKFWDGGFTIGGDNLPITPLYENEGIRNFITVELYEEQKISIPADCHVVRIRPEKSLGMMLYFDRNAMLSRMEQGYRDAMNVLSVPDMSEQEKALRNAIHSRAELDEFFQSSRLLNAPLPVTDAGIFWDDICMIHGCRLQQHRLLLNQRFIDMNGIRRAWWMNSKEFFDDLQSFVNYHQKLS